jgi:drug/metabolite transporter (DMT)-like permease
MIIIIIFWTIIFCLCNTFSIVLLGDRSLISGDLFHVENMVRLVLNWKFILAMALAVVTRISFIMLNNSLLKIPRLASVSTSICTFITLLSLIFILLANYFFLNEKLNLQQAIGAVIVLAGIAIMVK